MIPHVHSVPDSPENSPIFSFWRKLMKHFLLVSSFLFCTLSFTGCESQTNTPASVASPSPAVSVTPVAAASPAAASATGNAKNESGMKTTPSGLQYQDLVVGDGAQLKVGDIAQVYYTGTLQNGTKFDGNVGKSPLSFKVGMDSVIKGWHLGIGGGKGIEPMRIGGKRKIILPPDLGYGATGNGVIPSNATLIFEIEVVGTRKAKLF
jgi:peptidylprolyl isomerase